MKKRAKRNPDTTEVVKTAAKWYFIYLPLIFLGVLGIGAYFMFRNFNNSAVQTPQLPSSSMPQLSLSLPSSSSPASVSATLPGGATFSV